MRNVLSAFPDARRSGAGWIAKCPAHDDQHASLSFARGETAAWVFHCHAGCRYEQIVQAAGLTTEDVTQMQDDSAPGLGQIVETYNYVDEGGALLYQVVRYAPKTFRVRRLDPSGKWVWQLGAIRRVLYRLPELIGRDRVFVTEGEKDVDRLWRHGVAATCNSGGAGKWQDDYAQQLREAGVRRVVILPDADEPGRQHAEHVRESCNRAGLGVHVVCLPDLPTTKGADVSDWLNAGHSFEELCMLADTPAPAPDQIVGCDSRRRAASGLLLTPLSELLAEKDDQHEWLVDKRIPCGSLVLFAGKPKTGKSTSARDLAYAVATGGAWLGHACQRGSVWYLALEEKRGEVRRHFRMMGATGEEAIKVFVAQAPADLVRKLRELAEQEHPALIIVDTLARLLQARDLNDYSEVVTKLDPVIHIARTTGAALVLLHHANKSLERSGQDAILGSTALAGSVDNILLLTRTDRYRVLSSVQRIGPDLDETVVTLSASGRVELGASRCAADVAHVHSAMLGALATADGPMTGDDLLSSVEARRGVKLEALRTAVAEGTVARSGRGTKGEPYVYALSRISDSGSQVPMGEQEPESESLLPIGDSGVNSGSRAPADQTGSAIHRGSRREPESEVLLD